MKTATLPADLAADAQANANANANAGAGAQAGADAQPGAAPHPWLLADIGGTNARFGWVGSAGGPLAHVCTLPVAAHSSPADAAQAYLQQLQTTLGAAYRAPRAAAWAVATPVGGDQVVFTNSGWAFSRADTQAQLGLQTLLILNDFEALALSLPRLQAAQLRAWPGVQPLPALDGHQRRALAVVGPGTGLGVAGLVPTAHGGWAVVPGEGGHSTLAPGDAFDSEVLAFVRQEHDHVSAERLLSGLGLPLLHRAVCSVLGTPIAASAEWPTPQIVTQGLAGDDAAAARTIDCFCAMLGGFAGNVALLLGARGGVFIGGGIVPRLGEQFFASRFRQRFEAKGRMRGYLAATPTLLITDTLAALSGAAHALQLHRA